MTDKITDLEVAVIEAAMRFVEERQMASLSLTGACHRLSEARAALEPVPGEAEAWASWSPAPSAAWNGCLMSTKDAFRAALRIAIKADREARNG